VRGRLLGATGTAAEAEPTPSGSSGAVTTRSGTIQSVIHATSARDTSTGRVPDAALQVPPSNCQDIISGQYFDQYAEDPDLLLTLEWEWTGKILCTGPAGSSLASAEVTYTTLWNDDGAVSSGPFAYCENCSLLNSFADWTCAAGPACGGYYWESAHMVMVDPPGYHWTNATGACSITTSDARVLTCDPITNVVYIPPALD